MYLYNGNTRLKMHEFYGTSEYDVYDCTFILTLQELGAISSLNIRYQASTSGWWIFSSSDSWQTDEVYMEISYIAKDNDINSPEFYWHYQYPFD